ncbi:MAG: hypothetical protein MJ200_04255 [Mycoplasmoidaceae bacterium]|nr:hypothetical protein [Mycoplasmoidaceae bacterium]
MKITNPREYAIKLVKKVLKGKNGDIISVKDIHLGYTNISYMITFENNKKYQVRLPHSADLINRANE